jgi:hypothetical protein
MSKKQGKRNNWSGFFRWMIGDPRRALWGLLYLVVVLGFLFAVALVISPHLGVAVKTFSASTGLASATRVGIRQVRRLGR